MSVARVPTRERDPSHGRQAPPQRARCSSANGRARATASSCWTKGARGVASGTAPSPRSPAPSPVCAGRDHGSLDSDGLRRHDAMEHGRPKLQRCAIYTRKSSEEGLEQDFNSLHAQREASEAFIRSQAGEGWRLIKTAYDDGGFSGGTMERPALQRLLTDIRERLIDTVVVYKVDRLTRSLADFAKMVELFDERGISFVAVTQQFNTTTSMGRLTLKVLLSFAQFEREVTGERIRDKIAASKRKGMRMGGVPSLGYDIRDRRLVVNPAEAETVRHIYEHYLELRCVRQLSKELEQEAIKSKVRVSQKGIKSGGCRFRVEHCTNYSPTRFTSARYATSRSAIRGSTKRFCRRNSGRECSSGSTRTPHEAGEAQPGPLPVPLRESSLTQMVSRYTCRERPRPGGAIATMYPNASSMARPVITERAGDSRRQSLSAR